MGRSTAVQEDQRWSMKEFGEVSDKPQIRWRYRDQFTRPPGLKEDWINTLFIIKIRKCVVATQREEQVEANRLLQREFIPILFMFLYDFLQLFDTDCNEKGVK